MKKIITILFIVFRLGLGGLMVYGGIGKFTGPMPAPNAMLVVDDAKKAELLKSENGLRIRNYMFGMKQSGFAWQLLGIAELLGGILLISQFFSVIGALILLPITLHIFLLHAQLESDEPSEVLTTFLYFFINILIIAKEYKLFKPLLKIKIWNNEASTK